MQAFIVLAAPHEEQDLDMISVLKVEHATKGPEDFEKEWDEALDNARELTPEWEFDDIVRILRRSGWDIHPLDQPTSFVTY